MNEKRTRRQVRIAALVVVCCAALPIASQAQGAPVRLDDEARLLAGLPVSAGSPLVAVEASAACREHAAELAKQWAELESARLTAMSRWAQEELAPRIKANAPLVYLFAGPDVISANVLHPAAPIYVLCGLEPIGLVPPLASLPPEALDEGLVNLRASLQSILSLTHFITTDMAADLRRTELKGVLPLLFLFLARAENHIEASQLVYLDRSGKLVDAAGGRTPADGVPGVKIVFRSEHQPSPQQLYYFRIDLANVKVATKPGFFPFIESLGVANSLLKAASFILHDPGFSATRDFLLDHSASILQDDSGIPYRAFSHERWDFYFFGKYMPPMTIFKGSYQADLDKAFAAAAPVKPLPFSTGYSHSRRPSLMLAVAK